MQHLYLKFIPKRNIMLLWLCIPRVEMFVFVPIQSVVKQFTLAGSSLPTSDGSDPTVVDVLATVPDSLEVDEIVIVIKACSKVTVETNYTGCVPAGQYQLI